MDPAVPKRRGGKQNHAVGTGLTRAQKRIAREEQQNECLKLAMAGVPYREIAKAMGFASISTVYSRIQAALDAMRPHADFDRYRSNQLAELKLAREVLIRVIVAYGTEAGKTIEQTLGAIDRLVRIQEREAKLLGLDRVPTPFDEVARLSDEEIEEWVTKWAETLAERASKTNWGWRNGDAIEATSVVPAEQRPRRIAKRAEPLELEAPDPDPDLA